MQVPKSHFKAYLGHVLIVLGTRIGGGVEGMYKHLWEAKLRSILKSQFGILFPPVEFEAYVTATILLTEAEL